MQQCQYRERVVTCGSSHHLRWYEPPQNEHNVKYVHSRNVQGLLLAVPQHHHPRRLPNKLLADKVAERNALPSPAAQSRQCSTVRMERTQPSGHMQKSGVAHVCTSNTLSSSSYKQHSKIWVTKAGPSATARTKHTASQHWCCLDLLAIAGCRVHTELLTSLKPEQQSKLPTLCRNKG
jgi:hypothetical protein